MDSWMHGGLDSGMNSGVDVGLILGQILYWIPGLCWIGA